MTFHFLQRLSRPAQLTFFFSLAHGALDCAGTAVGVLANPVNLELVLALTQLALLSVLLSLVHLGLLNTALVALFALARKAGLATSPRLQTASLALADFGFLAFAFLGVEYYDNQVYAGMPIFGPVTGYLMALAGLCGGAFWLHGMVDRIAPSLWRRGGAAAAAALALSLVFRYEPDVQVTASAEGRPNVIFFVVDTLRAKSMSLYGYERETTPQIDAIARESALVFDRAYVQYPMSTASHASIYSGCYPFNHRAYGNGWTIPDEVSLISERFRQAGYHTAAFHSHAFLGADEAFDQGFDTFVETHEPELLNSRPIVWRYELRLMRAYEILLRRETVRTLLFDWLEDPPQPFYLWLHTAEPHDSYRPPRRLWQKFYGREYSGKMDGRVRTSVDYATETTPDDLEHMIARYDGEIAWADELYGRLIRRLQDLGIDRNTLVVLTADHGECFGEHDCYFDHGELYEESIHVPLVLRFPGTVPVGSVAESVELVDAAPTILKLAGIQEASRFCDGEDLSLLWSAGPQNLPPALAWKGHAVAAMDEGLKLIVKNYPDGARELYDLDADPGELVNVAAQRPDDLARLEAAIQEGCNSSPEALKVCLRTHAGPEADLGEAALQKLRSLGYVD